MAQKPSIPKGTRDFSPAEMVRRNFIFDTIRAVFKKYGYQQIETPAMENTETLMGKYGVEGDKLIFRILNNSQEADTIGNSLSDDEIRNNFIRSLGKALSNKALRYDLTVPFARYVVQHQNEISFPFKRYQIQPVWRGDRPQRGRYREFFQCDADVIGSNSLLNEVELVQMIDEVFTAFNVKVKIHYNNRKVLQGIADVLGYSDRMIDIAIAIDKLDKIGVNGVMEELRNKNIQNDRIESLISSIVTNQFNDDAKSLLASSEIAKIGLKEIGIMNSHCLLLGLREDLLKFDLSLARGLNYYTGMIFEVKVDDERSTFTSSICGGGRYDDLTGIFGLPNMSGVGISFGIDRIFDVLNEVGYPGDVEKEGTRVLFANFGGEDEKYSLQLLKKLREQNIASEIYPDAVKMAKQFKYADAKKIPFVVVIGENERKENKVMLKNMQSGEQEKMSFDEMLHKIK